MLTRDTHIPLLNSPEGKAAIELQARILIETAIDNLGEDIGENPVESAYSEAVQIVHGDVVPDLLSAVRRAAEERF